MKKIFQYILMTVALVATASCSNELDDTLQPAEKMIWGTSIPLKGLIAHLHTYMIGGIDSGWIDRAAASISTSADECRKRTTSVIR